MTENNEITNVDTGADTGIHKSGGLLAGGGLLGGIGAFVGASCCVLPIILFNMGVSSAVIARLVFFARHTDAFLIASLVFIGAGTFWAFRGGNRPGRGAVLMLVLSLTLVATAYVLPFYELDLLRYFRFRG